MTQISQFIAASLASAALLSAPAATQKGFRFEVFSIRPAPEGLQSGGLHITPNGFTSRISLRAVLATAYGPAVPLRLIWTSVKMLNVPDWVDFGYDIEARVEQSDLPAWQSQGKDHELLRAALQAALKARCRLAVHEQMAQEPDLELVVAKSGPKLKTAAPDSTLPVGVKLESGGVMSAVGARGEGGWAYHSATTQDLAFFLSALSQPVPVRDKTGLTGRYDFPLPHVQLPLEEDRVYSYPVDALGLRLRRGTENRAILVIDHIEKPTPN